MNAIKHILLATDLEPHSDRAMERAVMLAGQLGADLTALYAIRTGAERGILDNLPPHHIEAEMLRHLGSVPGARELALMTVAAKGPVEEAMAHYAELWKADLMVAGRAQPSDGLLSVTTVEKISVASPRPLLAVTAKPFGPYAGVLVPVDFSPLSHPALRAALVMIPTVGAIDLLHVHDVPSALTSADVAVSTEDFADGFAPLLRGIQAGDRLITTGVRLGAPIAEIVRAAQESSQTQLIVMGSSGRSGLGRALIGSVAHEVLERAPCDVLIVGGNGMDKGGRVPAHQGNRLEGGPL